MKDKACLTNYLLCLSVPPIRPDGQTTVSDEIRHAAEQEGYYSESESAMPYLQLFDRLCSAGGTVVFKPGLNAEFKMKFWSWAKALSISVSTTGLKDRRAVCAMMFSRLLNPELDDFTNESH